MIIVVASEFWVPAIFSKHEIFFPMHTTLVVRLLNARIHLVLEFYCAAKKREIKQLRNAEIMYFAAAVMNKLPISAKLCDEETIIEWNKFIKMTNLKVWLFSWKQPNGFSMLETKNVFIIMTHETCICHQYSCNTHIIGGRFQFSMKRFHINGEIEQVIARSPHQLSTETTAFCVLGNWRW